ncbi:hypothetical protein BU14_0348s0009 [Porphyra umbilicalis]|uniref:Uncharacterized protein n=1 Tax=Porphyra umbilicalis TaxID=2786 RepID=A0A1X6NXX7_PORUM|nr:hypothetical protein BU14_0348s0009 [Porphyra umbilicalis]|eukprot:OSX73432.1 hypothetical protein BU14_0348s0009 [Porphyra umbilicalis]
MAMSRWVLLLMVAAAAVIHAVQGDNVTVPDHESTQPAKCNNTARQRETGEFPFDPWHECWCSAPACVMETTTSRKDAACRSCTKACKHAWRSTADAYRRHVASFRRHQCAFKRQGTAAEF